jgi:hypothetical protein
MSSETRLPGCQAAYLRKGRRRLLRFRGTGSVKSTWDILTVLLRIICPSVVRVASAKKVEKK